MSSMQMPPQDPRLQNMPLGQGQGAGYSQMPHPAMNMPQGQVAQGPAPTGGAGYQMPGGGAVEMPQGQAAPSMAPTAAGAVPAAQGAAQGSYLHNLGQALMGHGGQQAAQPGAAAAGPTGPSGPHAGLQSTGNADLDAKNQMAKGLGGGLRSLAHLL